MTVKSLSMLERAKELQDNLVKIRRQIHQYPELSFQEHQTSQFAAERLKELGYNVTTGIARTGVVAELGAGKAGSGAGKTGSGAGKIVAVRADMDALPILEENQVAYCSKNEGVMHACGHDAHVACALGVAQLLGQEDRLAGRVRILMQPAEEDVDEETKSGARRMIEGGAMDGVAAVVGLHMDSSLAAGKVAIMPGPIMAAADAFEIVITGKGGHGAYPETTVDAVVIASQLVMTLQQIVSRRVSALEPAVVTVGSFHSSSSRGNVISESVTLQGTIRSFSDSLREKLMAEVRQVSEMVRALGAEVKVDFEVGYPATINHERVAEIMRSAAVDLIGEANVVILPQKTWAEDFSMLARVAPGAFMFLGGEIAGDRRSHHSPHFDIDESGLYVGSAILAETTKRLFHEDLCAT